MSTDAKNSVLLWVGAIVFFGLFWAILQFDIVPDIIPPKAVWIVGAAGIAWNLFWLAVDAVKRIRKGGAEER